MEQLAHSFDVSLTDRWSDVSEPVPIEGGDECVVLIDGQKISTGYVDDDGLDYDATNKTLSFQGRSKTEDLVDCAAIHRSGQWRNKGLLQIAKDICDPFGISASTAVDLGRNFKNPNFKIQEGETAFECLSRGARMRGVLMMTDANGDLYFDRAGTQRVTTVIERGKNVIRCSKRNSWKHRYSQYIIKTQASGNDDFYGSSTSIKRTSVDSGVTRYRPTVIVAENEDSGTELQKRADWERNVRAGRSKRITYTIPGWTHSDGLWSPNTMIRVIDPVAQIDDELLAVSVMFSRSDEGTFTSIDLTLKEAFDVQPLPPEKRESLY